MRPKEKTREFKKTPPLEKTQNFKEKEETSKASHVKRKFTRNDKGVSLNSHQQPWMLGDGDTVPSNLRVYAVLNLGSSTQSNSKRII